MKCMLKMFKAEAFGEKPDFSGFNRADWPLQNLELHRLYASKYKYAVTKTEFTADIVLF